MELTNTSRQRENFILIGDPNAQSPHIEAIVSKAKSLSPEKFEGKSDFFSFELRYTAPFDKNFHELKRLQGTAAEAAGRRDEFRGYIVINLSNYLSHENEDYFHKALLFLSDMSFYWKYIFLVDGKNVNAARALVCRVLNILIHNNILCEVQEPEPQSSFEDMVNTICNEQGIICSSSVKELLKRLLAQEAFSKEIISAFIKDISWNCGPRINRSALDDFFSQRESVIKYMLKEKEYCHFVNIITQQKENWHGEKIPTQS